MKTSTTKPRWIKSIISIVAIIAAHSALGISTPGAVTATATSDPASSQVRATVQYSAGTAEILKMVDAKVEGSVILAYIDSSPVAYNPSASEIIMLKDRGVASEIIAAMLKHGSEMRARAMAAAPPPPSAPAQQYPNATAPYTESPDYAYSSPTVYPDYTYPSSAYYYNYSYPYYGYSYPWYGYWPSAYFGYYPYHRYYNHYYPYRSYSHFGHGDHLTAFRGNFNGRFGTMASRGSGFRTTMRGAGRSVTIGSHVGGFRSGFSGGGFHAGGGFHGGGGFTAHAAGGGGRGR